MWVVDQECSSPRGPLPPDSSLGLLPQPLRVIYIFFGGGVMHVFARIAKKCGLHISVPVLFTGRSAVSHEKASDGKACRAINAG